MRIDVIEINITNEESIYKQLFDFIKNNIISGRYAPGDILPSSRRLAIDINVSRTSVFNAYNSLIAEGYITSIAGSGYIINTLPIAIASDSKNNEVESEVQEKRFLPFSPYPIDFSFFPANKWAKITSKIGRENVLTIFSSSQNDKFGRIELREVLRKYLYEIKGIECVPEQIVITSGTMESLEICVNLLTLSGTSLGIEDPCYPPMFHFLSKSMRDLNYMQIDYEGANPDSLSPECKTVIITPDCQFPLGITMSLQRRIEFIKWAKEKGGWIIEDNYDSDFNLNYTREKTIFSMDEDAKTIYLGSFSRLIVSELRVGYIVFPRSLLDTFSNTEYTVKASSLPQIILSEFIKSGDFYRNLVKVRKKCLEKRQYFVMLLNEHLNMYGRTYDSHAGSFVVFLLEQPLSDEMFVLYAKDRGVDLRAMSSMSHNSGINGLLMGYVYFNRDVLKKSIYLLKDILTSYCAVHKIDTLTLRKKT